MLRELVLRKAGTAQEGPAAAPRDRPEDAAARPRPKTPPVCRKMGLMPKATLLLLLAAFQAHAAAGPRHTLELPPSAGNPRNTEGSFIRLKDGHLLYAYSKFTGGTEDHATADIVTRTSSDGGLTWSPEDTILVKNDGRMNVMSVSFVRLRSGAIALFTVRKNSMLDCRPVLRLSRDEGKTWSAPRLTIREPGYYVLNNDRVIELKSGRLVLPVALHRNPSNDPKQFNGRGIAMCYLSDNQGRTWRRSKSVLENTAASKNGLQEPGVVELKDGRLLMFIRTSMGSQYFSYSRDGGDHWSPPQPSALTSPLSPATIERIPQTGDLLAVWNNHAQVDEAWRAVDVNHPDPQRAKSGGRRTPLTVAISRDEGQTWEHAKDIETESTGWYCYTAVEFAGDRVLLGYVAGGAGLARLIRSVVTALDLAWVYQ